MAVAVKLMLMAPPPPGALMVVVAGMMVRVIRVVGRQMAQAVGTAQMVAAVIITPMVLGVAPMLMVPAKAGIAQAMPPITMPMATQ